MTRPLLGLLALAVSLAAGPARAQSAAPVDALVQVAKTYGIDIVAEGPTFPVKLWHGAIDGKPADPKGLETYAGLFVREFTLYPPDLIRRAHLKRVVLCEALAFAGQLRAAVPDLEHDTLFLDVSRGRASKLYQSKVLHHEFFHIIDYRDDGHLYRDDRWATLNPPGFKYGDGGRNAQTQRGTAVLSEQYPGFLNHYSTTGVEEDKAEVFANLIVEFGYVEGRIGTDSVLRDKVGRIKALLVGFCPDVNDAFWEKVKRKRRPEAR